MCREHTNHRDLITEINIYHATYITIRNIRILYNVSNSQANYFKLGEQIMSKRV